MSSIINFHADFLLLKVLYSVDLFLIFVDQEHLCVYKLPLSVDNFHFCADLAQFLVYQEHLCVYKVSLSVYKLPFCVYIGVL